MNSSSLRVDNTLPVTTSLITHHLLYILLQLKVEVEVRGERRAWSVEKNEDREMVKMSTLKNKDAFGTISVKTYQRVVRSGR